MVDEPAPPPREILGQQQRHGIVHRLDLVTDRIPERPDDVGWKVEHEESERRERGDPDGHWPPDTG
jgi:hypothetical protein